MTEARELQSAVVGPSDREVVSLLQRLASARAQLLQAERAADQVPVLAPGGDRHGALEDAHTELLWAQAGLLSAQREQKAQRTVEAARRREREVLQRFGYSSFREYLAGRTSIPTTDVHLEVARAEFAAAQAEWDALQREIAAAADSSAPTVVIDLTGSEPRRIA